MEEPKEKDKGEVQFNLGQAQLELISRLLDQSSIEYLEGNQIKWFYALKNIKFQIVSRLNTGERKELDLKERLINLSSRIYNNTGKREDRNKLGYYIEQYDTRIKELLEVKGFLVPLRKSRTSLYGQEAEE